MKLSCLLFSLIASFKIYYFKENDFKLCIKLKIHLNYIQTIKNKNNNSYIYFKLQIWNYISTIAAYVYSIQSCLLHEIKFICACKS